MSLISLDLTGCVDADFGFSQDQLRAITPQMEQRRAQFLTDVENAESHFFRLPMQQYQAYQDTREASPLGQVFDIGTSLHDDIDAVVVVGTAAATAAARAVFHACCDPYHNELSRADRGSRPRMYFAGDRFDNDRLASLLHRLDQKDFRDSPSERCWAMVVLDPIDLASKDTFEVLRALSTKREPALDPQRIFPIVDQGSWLDLETQRTGCGQRFARDAAMGVVQQTLSFDSLLPAAMLGLDCIKLLEGAVMMNEHFETAVPDQNVVMQFVAAHQLLSQHQSIERRRWQVWPSALDWLPSWYPLACDAPTAASISKQVVTHVVAGSTRYDPVTIPSDTGDGHDGNLLGRMRAALDQSVLADRAEKTPALILHLPAIDTRVLGQVFQMLLIASTLESPALPCPASYVRH